jgi:hypothetical protein
LGGSWLKDSPGKKLHKIPISLKKLVMVAHARHIPVRYGRKHKTEGSLSMLVQVKKQDPISKTTRAKRAGDMAQTVKHLTSKHEALSFKPESLQRKKNIEQRDIYC